MSRSSWNPSGTLSENHHVEIEECIPAGDDILLTVHSYGRGKTSGVEVELAGLAYMDIARGKGRTLANRQHQGRGPRSRGPLGAGRSRRLVKPWGRFRAESDRERPSPCSPPTRSLPSHENVEIVRGARYRVSLPGTSGCTANAGGLVFASEAGTPLGHSNTSRRVLRPAAGGGRRCRWAGFHTFRHTCASLLFERGANAVQVQRWLGHHSAAFTLATYVHLLSESAGEPLSLSDELPGANKVQTDRTQTDPNSQPATGTDSALESETSESTQLHRSA